jgi:apolipoprotein N-acyltransferase
MTPNRSPGLFPEAICLLLSALFATLIAAGAHLLINLLLAPFLYIAFTLPARRVILFSLAYAGIISAVLFRWISGYNSDFFLYAWLAITLFFILFSILLVAGRWSLRPRFHLLLPPLIWYLIYSILNATPLGGYWLEPAVFQTRFGFLLSLVGAIGVSFLTLALNSAIALAAIQRKPRAWMPVAVLSFVFAVGLYRPVLPQPPGDGITVALVQGNFQEPWIWRQKHAYHPILDRYRALTEKAAARHPDLIVWPEYALPLDVLSDNPGLLRKIQALSAQLDGLLVIGSVLKVSDHRHYDALLMFWKGKLVDRYSSVRPILFNEETQAAPLENRIYNDRLRFGPVVCYEETQSDLFYNYARLGARFFVSAVNTQDFGEGTDLASLFGQLRSAEAGRYLVRASNTGVTAIIDPIGRVIQRLAPGQEGVLTGTIYPQHDKTLYARFGDSVLIGLMAGLLLLSRSGWHRPGSPLQ